MARILVTGGTEILGREAAARLRRAGYTVRIMSRREPQKNSHTMIEWAQADLESGAGLAEVVTGADVILHAASSPTTHTRAIDVLGTQPLLEYACAGGTWCGAPIHWDGRWHIRILRSFRWAMLLIEALTQPPRPVQLALPFARLHKT